jgi:hypothetical protein
MVRNSNRILRGESRVTRNRHLGQFPCVLFDHCGSPLCELREDASDLFTGGAAA